MPTYCAHAPVHRRLSTSSSAAPRACKTVAKMALLTHITYLICYMYYVHYINYTSVYLLLRTGASANVHC